MHALYKFGQNSPERRSVGQPSSCNASQLPPFLVVIIIFVPSGSTDPGGGVKTKIEISWNGCVLLSLKCADYIMTPSRTHSSMHGHITQFATDKRVYDVDVLMYDGDSLVSCMHGLAWHWHPVIWRMTVCLSPYWRSRRHLPSAESGCLVVTGARTALGSRSFAVAGAKIWSSLLADLRLHLQSLHRHSGRD